MNVGQILETHLGWACAGLGRQIQASLDAVKRGGKVSFEPDAIKGNLIAVLVDLKKAKPASAKGVYVRKVTLSTTMGPGVTIDHNAIDF